MLVFKSPLQKIPCPRTLPPSPRQSVVVDYQIFEARCFPTFHLGAQKIGQVPSRYRLQPPDGLPTLPPVDLGWSDGMVRQNVLPDPRPTLGKISNAAGDAKTAIGFEFEKKFFKIIRRERNVRIKLDDVIPIRH